MKKQKKPSSAAINRRSFIKRGIGGLAVGSAGFPLILPRRVLGGNGVPGANEQIVLGMIGVGQMGFPHVRTVVAKGMRIAGVAEAYRPNAERTAKWIRDQGINSEVQLTNDYRTLLERKDIDAVVISTPLRWHALQSIHAAQAGKDIYCEKALTFSIWEGRKIVEAVKKYKVVFQTGSQQRSGRMEHAGITHVRNGTIGKIKRILTHNYHSPLENGQPEQPIPAGLDWDLWCGPAEKPAYNHDIWTNTYQSQPCWSRIRQFAGGDMTEWGAHGLDLVQWGLNMDHAGPEEIWGEGDPFEPVISTAEVPGGRNSGPSSPKIFMKYPCGAVVEFGGGQWSGGRFIGENGEINVTRGGFSSTPAELAPRPMANPQEEIYRGFDYALKNDHFQDWMNCMAERRDPVAHAEVGHRTATVCHLANITRWVSRVTGVTGYENRLKWDAVNERFSNSDVANQYLRFPERKGFEIPENV